MKKKVYIPNKGLHDYTNAWSFGDLVFCTDGQVNRRDLHTMHSELSTAMDEAEEDDYILITGLTALCSIACGIFASRFGKLNLLIHEGGGRYLERSITL